MSETTDYDLVIVGASFAGLVCARTAAMRGLKVAVIDQKPEPGARVRTTGIVVKEAADRLDLPAALTRKIRQVRLYGPSLDHIDLDSPGYYFLATHTAGLLRWLAREALQAGARLLFGTRFQGARRTNGGLRLDRLGLTTRYLIGADGARSAVARAFALGQTRRFLFGLEAEFAGDCGVAPGYLHCLIDRRLAPGYIAWIVPGVGITQVGLARPWPGKPDLKGVLAKAEAIGRFAGVRPIAQRAALIPVGGLVSPLATDNVCLIGDAAGLVSPMTAGGIHNAFHYGRRAGQLVAEHLLDGAAEPGRRLAREAPKHRLKGLARQLMAWGPPDWLADLALQTPAMAALARQIYFHHRGPGRPPRPNKYFKARTSEG